ncbi:MAG: hypothetical protein ABF630_11330 [Liquorilactobacillus sp.]|jgi:uncharacterized membrane protein (DUF485 family)
MAKVIVGKDGKKYKQVDKSTNRKRTLEIILSTISLILSVFLIGSGLGATSFIDAMGGGGYYTAKFLLGILLAIMAFVLTFFLNRKHTLFSSLILAIGIVILLTCGEFGIVGGAGYIITGIVALVRK